MLIDTHCHINSKFYGNGVPEIIRRAGEAGVGALLNAGIDIPTSMEASELHDRFPSVYFSPGIHPRLAAGAGKKDIEMLWELASSGKAAAAGETGLDFFKTSAEPEKQAEMFRETIAAARENSLPVIVHNRNADRQVFEILSEAYSGDEEHPNGVLHCFSSGYEFAERCIRLNFYVSFAGNLTYPGAGRLREAAGKIPLDRVLLETDSPFLAPQKERGKKNEPAFIAHTAGVLAGIKDLSADRTMRLTSRNAFKVFPRLNRRPGK